MVNIIGAICLLYIFSCFYVWLDNLVDDIINKIKGFINVKISKIVPKTKSYKSVEEMVRNGKIRELYLYIYRFFLHIKEFPEDSYYNIKYFIQRGIYGYSRLDVWGFGFYLSKVIVNALKDLKKMAHGHPCGMVGIQGVALDKDDKDLQEWKRILQEIIWTFEITLKVQDRDWCYCSLAKDRKKHEKWAKECNIHLMTKEECDRYKQGWKYFQEYYFDLWD